MDTQAPAERHERAFYLRKEVDAYSSSVSLSFSLVRARFAPAREDEENVADPEDSGSGRATTTSIRRGYASASLSPSRVQQLIVRASANGNRDNKRQTVLPRRA